MTPSDLLRMYARMAEEHPLATVTKAGQDLQRAMVAFMAEADDPSAATHDLFMLTARAFICLHLAKNGGALDEHQIYEMLIKFHRAVGRETVAFDRASKRKGTH